MIFASTLCSFRDPKVLPTNKIRWFWKCILLETHFIIHTNSSVSPINKLYLNKSGWARVLVSWFHKYTSAVERSLQWTVLTVLKRTCAEAVFRWHRPASITGHLLRALQQNSSCVYLWEQRVLNQTFRRRYSFVYWTDAIDSVNEKICSKINRILFVNWVQILGSANTRNVNSNQY